MEIASAAELYRVTFANLKEALVIVRLAPDGLGSPAVVELNRSAQKLSKSLSGKEAGTFADRFPGIFDDILAQRCRETADSGVARELGETGHSPCRYRVSIIPLLDRHVGILLSDTSALKNLEQASVSLRKLSALLLSTLEPEEILDDLIKETAYMLDAESGVAALCSAEGISSYRYFVKGEPVPLQPPHPDGKIPGRVITGAEPYLSNDAANDPQLDREGAARQGIASALSTPILDASGEMIGFLEIHNKKDECGFSSFDLDQLSSAARITSLAVRNAEAFRLLERRVAERTAELQEINEELDSFAHSVSHDLKAPLRALQGYAGILLDEQQMEEPERLAYLNRILATAQWMERLVGDLLAYSRLSRQELVLKPVSLEKVVRDAAQQLELAGVGKGYRLEVSEKLPEVLGHHAVLVQVVLNLMSNGIKFVPKGVTPRLRIKGELRDGHVRLLVEDNGIGIPKEHQEKIFKIFERLHGADSYPGTGVGLAIVRKALHRLGGRIGVESREGEGSRFWIELPAAQVTKS